MKKSAHKHSNRFRTYIIIICNNYADSNWFHGVHSHVSLLSLHIRCKYEIFVLWVFVFFCFIIRCCSFGVLSDIKMIDTVYIFHCISAFSLIDLTMILNLNHIMMYVE